MAAIRTDAIIQIRGGIEMEDMSVMYCFMDYQLGRSIDLGYSFIAKQISRLSLA
jgi:hypothetical protein